MLFKKQQFTVSLSSMWNFPMKWFDKKSECHMKKPWFESALFSLAAQLLLGVNALRIGVRAWGSNLEAYTRCMYIWCNLGNLCVFSHIKWGMFWNLGNSPDSTEILAKFNKMLQYGEFWLECSKKLSLNLSYSIENQQYGEWRFKIFIQSSFASSLLG